MSIKNVIIFGKDPENTARVVGITGVENNELKIISIENKDKYLTVLKELKKLNTYLSFMTDTIINNQDIGEQ